MVDPPDGRIPALTAEAAARETARKKHWNQKKDSPDTWMDLTHWDRCITLGPVGSVMPNAYDNGQEIVQAPGYVVFRNEMIHEARVIPLDGRPHASPEIQDLDGRFPRALGRQDIGRGDYQLQREFLRRRSEAGGFGDAGAIATDQLRLIERFTRTDQDTIQYEITVNDPKTWTAPWKISMPLRRDASYDRIYEYACHEGNIFMHDALSGARADEKRKPPKQRRSIENHSEETVRHRGDFMRYQNRWIALAVFAVTAVTVSAQQPAAKTATASKTWKQPETPWGDPDLQGVWPSQNMIGVPMERDPKSGDARCSH